MNAPNKAVTIVSGDPSSRAMLRAILEGDGFKVVLFSSAAEFQAWPDLQVAACHLFDVDLPDMNGLELQRSMARHTAPIVFVTQRRDIASSVRAIKAGAVDFLTMPVDANELLQSVRVAIDLDRTTRPGREWVVELERRRSRLTPREGEVLQLVVSGCSNKEVARELGISTVTVQIHRGRLVRKMSAHSLADLVRMADTLEIPLAKRTRRDGRSSMGASAVSFA